MLLNYPPLACLVLLLLTESRQHAWHAPGRHHMGRDPVVARLPADLHLHILLLQRPAERPQHHPQEPLHQPVHCWVTLSSRDQQGRSASKKFVLIIMHVGIHIICLAKGSGTLFLNKNIKEENEKVDFIFCLNFVFLFFPLVWHTTLPTAIGTPGKGV